MHSIAELTETDLKKKVHHQEFLHNAGFVKVFYFVCCVVVFYDRQVANPKAQRTQTSCFMCRFDLILAILAILEIAEYPFF